MEENNNFLKPASLRFANAAQPNIQVTFITAGTRCWPIFHLLSTRTPTTFSSKSLSSSQPGVLSSSTPLAWLCTYLCWILWDSCLPIYSDYCGPFDLSWFLWAALVSSLSTVSHSLVPFVNLARNYAPSCGLLKILNSIVFRISPWGMTLVTGLLAIGTMLWVRPSTLFLPT